MYTWDSILRIVTKDLGKSTVQYVGLADTFPKAAELAAKHHEDTTGIKGACISLTKK